MSQLAPRNTSVGNGGWWAGHKTLPLCRSWQVEEVKSFWIGADAFLQTRERFADMPLQAAQRVSLIQRCLL